MGRCAWFHCCRREVELGLSTSEQEGTDNEGFAQDWFEEDYDLSNTRREAEALRLQQLQIEQEIQQLEQAQEHLPYFYYREIPNKPPPPYTPPGQTTGTTPSKQEEEECRIIPSKSEELTSLVLEAANHLYGIIATGGDLVSSQAPPGFYEESSSVVCEVKSSSRRIFKKMIFDLTKDIVKDVYSLQGGNSCKPWEWPTCSHRRMMSLPHSKEALQKQVCKEMLVLFGVTPKVQRGKNLICWSRKKRDIVDEILMKETHDEDAEWSNYEESEVIVKNEIALGVLDSLIDETVQILLDIRKTRLKKP